MNSITSPASPPDRKEAIAAIVGSETMAELDAAWAAFSDLSYLQVTLYGPYDAGKTTLIRRLLTEDGTPVPSWLTISGRPETVKVTEVESEGIGYVDTPGTAGRSAEHDQLAEEALALTHAVLVVLPQQRLPEDTGRLIELAASGCPPDALLVAIAQSDTVGADPQSDLEEFRQLCERRRGELLKMLPSELAGALAGRVHVIAADPYGEVGNAGQPDRAHYDAYRAWDGIAELRARLASLTRCLPELRDAARHRFWARAAALARAEGDREMARLGTVLEEAEQRRQRQALLDQELTTIDAAAVGDLREAIGNEFNALLTAAGTDMEAIRSAIGEQLQQRLSAWQATYGGKLQALAQQADVELALQSADPRSVEYDRRLHTLVMPQRPEPPPSGSLAELMGAFADPAAKALQGAVRLHLRVPVDEARDQLKLLSDLKDKAGRRYRWQVMNLNPSMGNVQDQRAALDAERKAFVNDLLVGDSVFDDVTHAEYVRTWISRMDIAEDFVPAVMQMSGLIAEQIRDRRAARRELQKREDVKGMADRFTEEILGEIDNPAEGTWRHDVTSIRARLHADSLLEPVTEAARERMEIITSACRDLR